VKIRVGRLRGVQGGRVIRSTLHFKDSFCHSNINRFPASARVERLALYYVHLSVERGNRFEDIRLGSVPLPYPVRKAKRNARQAITSIVDRLSIAPLIECRDQRTRGRLTIVTDTQPVSGCFVILATPPCNSNCVDRQNVMAIALTNLSSRLSFSHNINIHTRA